MARKQGQAEEEKSPKLGKRIARQLWGRIFFFFFFLFFFSSCFTSLGMAIYCKTFSFVLALT